MLMLSLYCRFAKIGCKKICKIFASECGSKLGVMRDFQKAITLGGRTSGSPYDYSVTPVQSGVGVWSSEFGF